MMVALVTDQGSSTAREHRENSKELAGKGAEGHTSTPSIRDARQEIVDAFAKLDAQARSANPAKNDPLEVKANALRGLVEKVAGAQAAPEEVTRFIQGTKELASATTTELALRKNPWSLAVNSPLQEQDKKNYHQVITLSVPSGQIVDLRQDSSDRCGVKSSCVRLCPGTIAARDVNGSKVWRQPDPKNPGFDLITVATAPDKTVQTRCGLQEIKAFSGVMKFTNPCTCESYSVNVNNGAGNDHLKNSTVVEGVTVPERGSPLVTTHNRPAAEELQYASPSDNYRSQNFATFDAYSDYVSRYNQLPGKYSVARKDEGVNVILNDGETLTLYKGGSEVGTFNPNFPETKKLLDSDPGVVAVGNYATIRKGEHGEYLLEPGRSHVDTEFFAKITRMGARSGEVVQTIAERVIYIGDPSPGSAGERPAEQGYNEEAAKKLALKPPTTQLSLPITGTRVTSQQGVSFTLGDDVAQDLYISKDDGSPFGVLRPTDKKDLFEFSGAPEIKIVREGEGNTFRIVVAEGAREAAYKLIVRPRHNPGDIAEQTRIIVGGEPQSSDLGESPNNVTPRNSSPNLEAIPSQPKKEQKKEESSPQPPVQPSPTRSTEATQYVTKSTALQGEVRTDELRQPDGTYKLAVTAGESISIDLYRHDELGRRTSNALTDLKISSNTVKTSIPGVGSVRRVTDPEGKVFLVFTPEKGSRTGLSLAASK